MMKHYIIILLLFCVNIAIAQESTEAKKDTVINGTQYQEVKSSPVKEKYKRTNNSEEAIKEGAAAVDRQNFKQALYYYFAAEAFKPKERKKVKSLVREAFVKINALKEEAARAKEEAERQKLIADEARKKAEEALAEAERQKKIAVKEKKKAIAQEKIAKEQRIIAEEKTKIAEDALIEAEIQRKKAVLERDRANRLRIEALSKALALKSAAMRYDNQARIKGLLAVEAFNMQMTVNETSTSKGSISPEIYTGLYSALIQMKGFDYDEIKDGDLTKKKQPIIAHKGAVRSIVQTANKTIYTSGSDGRMIKWNIGEWNKSGRPDFTSEYVNEEEHIYLATAIQEGKGDKGGLIALGGKLSEFDLMNMKGENVKAEDVDLRSIYVMAFDGDLLYILGNNGKNGQIKVLNTKSNEVKTLKKFKKKAEQMAIHPNGQLIAVGYKDGSAAIFDIKKMDTPLYDFSFDSDKMDGEISVLKFDEVSHKLAIGTSKGYIGIIQEMEDGAYLLDSLKARKTHVFRISSIDFKEYKNAANNTVQPIMAVGSYDGTVSVWQLTEFSHGLYEPFMFEYHNAEGKNSWVTSLEFIENPDDNEHHQLMVGYFNGTIKFWGLEVESLANHVRCALGDDFKGKLKFTKAEVEKYHLKVTGFEVKNYVECDN